MPALGLDSPRKRAALVAAAAAAVAAVVAAAVILVNDDGDAPASQSLVMGSPEPTPTASAAALASRGASAPVPTSTPAVQATAIAAATGAAKTEVAEPSAHPSAAATPSLRSSAECPSGGGSRDCPDGQPGWSGPFTGCRDAVVTDVPAASPEVFDGVAADYTLARSRITSGQQLAGTVRLHSSRPRTVSFTIQMGTHYEAAAYGRAAGAVHDTDALAMYQVVLQPGGDYTLELPVATTSCGDTSSQAEPALPQGNYNAGFIFSFGDAVEGDPSSPGPTPSPFSSGQVSPQPSPEASGSPAPEAVPTDGRFAVRASFAID